MSQKQQDKMHLQNLYSMFQGNSHGIFEMTSHQIYSIRFCFIFLKNHFLNERRTKSFQSSHCKRMTSLRRILMETSKILSTKQTLHWTRLFALYFSIRRVKINKQMERNRNCSFDVFLLYYCLAISFLCFFFVCLDSYLLYFLSVIRKIVKAIDAQQKWEILIVVRVVFISIVELSTKHIHSYINRIHIARIL